MLGSPKRMRLLLAICCWVTAVSNSTGASPRNCFCQWAMAWSHSMDAQTAVRSFWGLPVGLTIRKASMKASSMGPWRAWRLAGGKAAGATSVTFFQISPERANAAGGPLVVSVAVKSTWPSMITAVSACTGIAAVFSVSPVTLEVRISIVCAPVSTLSTRARSPCLARLSTVSQYIRL